MDTANPGGCEKHHFWTFLLEELLCRSCVLQVQFSVSTPYQVGVAPFTLRYRRVSLRAVLGFDTSALTEWLSRIM